MISFSKKNIICFFNSDDEELEIPEEQTELRPLTHEELKLIAQRNIGKRVNTLAVPSPTKAAKSPRAT